MFRFKVTVGIILFLISMAYITNVSALDKTPPVSPMVLLDCGITAYNPVKSGTTVVGKGSISCASSHPSLKIVAGIKDVTGNRYTSSVKTCANASSCTVSASLSYISGRYWYTDVSGYQGTDWNAYTISSQKFIPKKILLGDMKKSLS